MSNNPGQTPQSQAIQQTVGSAPHEQVSQQAANAVSQLNPQDYQQHIQGGANGNTPLSSMSSDQLISLAQAVLSELQKRGVSQQTVQNQTGIPNLDPNQITPQNVASLLQWVQQNHPQALGNVAAQYKNQPDMLQAILGNKALMSMAAGLGAKFLSDEFSKRG